MHRSNGQEVALAMLHRNGRWLMQLRDDLETIIYPGHWGCSVATWILVVSREGLMRELQEEISWPSSNTTSLVPRRCSRIAHVFRGSLGALGAACVA